MLNDQPSSDDPLGRRPFAESIAKVITLQTDSSPQVIAIDGAWGEGKTTVFGFLKTALESRKFEVMEFNPWRHNSEEMMIRALVLGLAETLKVEILNKKDKVAEWAQGDGDWVKESVGAIGDGKFGKLIDFGSKRLRPTIDILTDRLKGELNCRAHRVTILVDDPDRLDADQLMGLFRLVKLIANFEWVTFVLAMDCEAVARTVGKRLESELEGRRFLEKIVQVPLRLPAVPHSKMLKFSLDLVDRVLSDLKIEISHNEVQRFRGVFDDALMPFVVTPRLAKQYANALRFALGFSKGEVNPVDVILLEGVRLLIPDAFRRLVVCVAPMSDSSLDSIFEDNSRNREEKSDLAFSAVFPEVKGPVSKRALVRLLSELFPGTFSGAGFGDSKYEKWQREKRVAGEDYMWRYLHCAVPDYDVGDVEMDEMIQAANMGEVEEVHKFLRQKFEPLKVEMAAKKLRLVVERLTSNGRSILAIAIAQNSDSFVRTDAPWQIEHAYGRAAYAAAELIRRVEPLAEREPTAAQALTAAKSALWARELFSSLPHLRKDGKVDLPFSEETSDRLGEILANRIMKELEEVSEKPSLELLHNFAVCIKFGRQQQFRDWLRKKIERDDSFLEHFAGALMTWSYGNEGRSFKWPGDDVVLKSMGECFDLDWFKKYVKCPEPVAMDGWDPGLTPSQIIFKMAKVIESTGEEEKQEETGDGPTLE